MKGNNELRLNTATMMVVVQEWLNREMPLSTPVVKNVTVVNQYAPEFVIELMEKEPEPK